MDLNASITNGSRVFKMYATRLENLGITTFADFLFHLPSRYEDFSTISKIADVHSGDVVTIQGQVFDMKNQYLRGSRIKSMQKAIVVDDSGTLELTWFNQPFLVKNIPVGSTISASGRIDVSPRKKYIKSPKFEILYGDQTKSVHTARLIPVYPETKGVSSKWLRRQIHTLIEQYADQLEEYLPEAILQKQSFMHLKEAIKEVHFPKNLDTAMRAKERLAFDELFLMQLAANKRRTMWRQKQLTTPFAVNKYQTQIEELIASLPFSLTEAQRKAIDDILHDFAKDKPMNRLLQGDVGSGKTIVAAVTMYEAYLNGFQAVLMAPTEILAEQHYKSIERLLTPLGVTVKLVTGTRKLKLEQDETFDILIGTHAVLSEKVLFDKLAYVVIDEQQRFGVEQRGIIKQKGNNPHLLTMTATPIPRTVALTMYGDLDLSYLNQMPHGRKKVKTWVVPPEKRDAAYEWIRKQIKETDSQAFIVCPFIEPSETMETIKAVNQEYERLRKDVYTDLKLGLLHGKLKAKEKDAVLEQFRNRAFDILVATPVVEVGIDIPNATIIMIEASERFGLAQLHQLRGRVGRGDKQSYCLLFTDSKQALNSERLKGMESIYSGAELAELDLRLRGPGNLYGTAQHGIPKLKVATFSDTELIQRAKYAADEVFHELEKYPLLEEKLEYTMTKIISPD